MKFPLAMIQCKHKEAFSTLIKSLVQMTCSDYTNFLKLVEFAMENSGRCTYLQKKVVKSRCRLGYSAEICILYCKLSQFQKICEIAAGHLYQGLDQSTKGFLMFDSVRPLVKICICFGSYTNVYNLPICSYYILEDLNLQSFICQN